MRLILRCILFLFVTFFSLLAWADDAQSQLLNELKQFQNMQADFVQTSYDSSGKQIQQSKGQMALQRPGLFYWKTQSPNQQLLIADGTYVWVYDADLEQATRQAMDMVKSTNPASLLSGSPDTLKQRFNVTSIPAAANAQAFELTPIQKNDLFQSIKIVFSNNQITQMFLFDNLGQKSTISFSNIKTNVKLDPALFHFAPPRGTDVITE